MGRRKEEEPKNTPLPRTEPADPDPKKSTVPSTLHACKTKIPTSCITKKERHLDPSNPELMKKEKKSTMHAPSRSNTHTNFQPSRNLKTQTKILNHEPNLLPQKRKVGCISYRAHSLTPYGTFPHRQKTTVQYKATSKPLPIKTTLPPNSKPLPFTPCPRHKEGHPSNMYSDEQKGRIAANDRARVDPQIPCLSMYVPTQQTCLLHESRDELPSSPSVLPPQRIPSPHHAASQPWWFDKVESPSQSGVPLLCARNLLLIAHARQWHQLAFPSACVRFDENTEEVAKV